MALEIEATYENCRCASTPRLVTSMMNWFRPLLTRDPPLPLTLDEVRALIGQAMAPAHFFVAPPLTLRWQPVVFESIRWELYQGRLLDPAHTRQLQRFAAWSVYQVVDDGQAAEPLLSVKLDIEHQDVYVVRGLLCYVWEAYDAGGNVVGSRETTKWTRELVGTIHLRDMKTTSEFLDELVCLLWQAVVGTSRLPLTSQETPMPAFALGQLAYSYRLDRSAPMTTWSDLVERGLAPDLSLRERTKLVEAMLRAVPTAEVPQAATAFLERWREIGDTTQAIVPLLRNLFNDVSLSPYTHFADNALSLLECLVDQGALSSADEIDFLSYLLRQQGRHLTAYDLFTFHHRGANYPDALLLEAVLARYLALVEKQSEFLSGSALEPRRRRRALRQACVLRRFYEGHLVPDAPTSPGENQRVLPTPFERVPEEQVLNPTRRRRQLFQDRPLASLLSAQVRQHLQQSLDDLHELDEVRELGVGVFIDRPFGWGKTPLEPDLTLLLAHEVFSPAIAERRLRELERLAHELQLTFAGADLGQRLRVELSGGIPIAQIAEPGRPVPALADARRVAEDGRVLRTLPGGLRAVLERVENPGALAFHLEGGCLVRVGKDARLLAYDRQGRARVELIVDSRAGFQRRAGVEWPRAGVRCLGLVFAQA